LPDLAEPTAEDELKEDEDQRHPQGGQDVPPPIGRGREEVVEAVAPEKAEQRQRKQDEGGQLAGQDGGGLRGLSGYGAVDGTEAPGDEGGQRHQVGGEQQGLAGGLANGKGKGRHVPGEQPGDRSEADAHDPQHQQRLAHVEALRPVHPDQEDRVHQGIACEVEAGLVRWAHVARHVMPRSGALR
jgi:hypothetical protein